MTPAMAQAWSIVGGTAMEIVISMNTSLACSRHRLLPPVTLEVIQSEYTCHCATSTVTVFLSYTYRLRFSHFTMDTSTSDDKSADNLVLLKKKKSV